jgi:hypothetical protein
MGSLTEGSGHSNAVSTLYTARAAEAPVALLSGHAAIAELGRPYRDLREAGDIRFRERRTLALKLLISKAR